MPNPAGNPLLKLWLVSSWEYTPVSGRFRTASRAPRARSRPHGGVLIAVCLLPLLPIVH